MTHAYQYAPFFLLSVWFFGAAALLVLAEWNPNHALLWPLAVFVYVVKVLAKLAIIAAVAVLSFLRK